MDYPLNPRTLTWDFCSRIYVKIFQAQNTATKFGIRSVPTFMFMEGTNVVDQVGGMDQDQLEEKCKKYGTPKKGEPKMIDVYCTLEELYSGKSGSKNHKIFESIKKCENYVQDAKKKQNLHEKGAKWMENYSIKKEKYHLPSKRAGKLVRNFRLKFLVMEKKSKLR